MFCLRLNAFAVPIQIKDFRIENFATDLTKVHNKPHFFQRSKNKQFPALLITDSDIIKIQDDKATCSFELGVIDKQITDCGSNCGYCHKRTVSEIQKDLKTMLLKVLHYLRAVACVKIDGQDNYEWHNEDRLKGLVSEGEISGYSVHFVSTRMFRSQIHQRVEQTIKFTQMVGDFHSAYFENITFTLHDECIDNVDWNFKGKSAKLTC